MAAGRLRNVEFKFILHVDLVNFESFTRDTLVKNYISSVFRQNAKELV